MVSIHAEASACHEQIVLVASGQVDVFSPEQMDVAMAARRLGILTPLFSKSDPPGAMTTALTWPAVVQLQSTFAEHWVPGPRLCAWIEAQVKARTAPLEALYAPPAGLTPYPWQHEGAALIAATGRALITDEPGTGKTITAIMGLVEWGRVCTHHDPASCPACHDGGPRSSCRPVSFRADVGPCVVVCPASVVDPWVEAWQAWAPHVRTVAWRGEPKKRRALAGTADVYVTSYETARMDAPPVGSGAASRDMRALLELDAAALVIDECHLVKNHQAVRTQAVRRIAKGVVANSGAVVALSGTPITHHPGDLWPTLACLEPEAWPSRERWVNRYCQVVPGDYRDEISGLLPSREPEFRLTLLGQHRRVAKADVLTQLPPKVYSVRSVELPTRWRKAYGDMEARMLAELPDGSELSVMSVLAQLTRLSQLASSAAEVAVTTETTDDGTASEHVKVTLKAPSWKVDALLEVLEERATSDDGDARCEPVVAFAPSRQLIMLAGAAAAAAGYRVGYIVGGQSMKERTATVAAFQAGELDLVCATTGAGGVGITLTAARTVVFLQRPWSLVESIQAEDRCHRIGSERHDSIEVIDVVARNTIDTRVRAVLRERAGQLADLVQDPRIVTELLGGTSTTHTPFERKAS